MATYTMPGSSAADAYAKRQAQLAEMIAVLQAQLAEHARRQAAEPRSWLLVGDLGAVSEWVGAAVGFLSGEEDDVLTPTAIEDLRERLQQKEAQLRRLEQAFEESQTCG